MRKRCPNLQEILDLVVFTLSGFHGLTRYYLESNILDGLTPRNSYPPRQASSNTIYLALVGSLCLGRFGGFLCPHTLGVRSTVVSPTTELSLANLLIRSYTRKQSEPPGNHFTKLRNTTKTSNCAYKIDSVQTETEIR